MLPPPMPCCDPLPPCFLPPAPQRSLNGMVGQSSGFIEAMPAPVRTRIDYLKELEGERAELFDRYRWVRRWRWRRRGEEAEVDAEAVAPREWGRRICLPASQTLVARPPDRTNACCRNLQLCSEWWGGAHTPPSSRPRSGFSPRHMPACREERRALDEKYDSLYCPLYDRRAAVVNGKAEAPENETGACAWVGGWVGGWGAGGCGLRIGGS